MEISPIAQQRVPCSINHPAGSTLDLIQPHQSTILSKPKVTSAPLHEGIDSIEQTTLQTSSTKISYALPPLVLKSNEFDLTGVEYQETTDTLKSAFYDHYLISSHTHYDLD